MGGDEKANQQGLAGEAYLSPNRDVCCSSSMMFDYRPFAGPFLCHGLIRAHQALVARAGGLTPPKTLQPNEGSVPLLHPPWFFLSDRSPPPPD